MLKKIFYILTTFFLVTASMTDAKGYNTREHKPVLQKPQPTYTQNQIDKAWIQVPWSHGGHYYHNTLTREDVDAAPRCFNK
jgi:hypothetical protein